MLRYFEANIQDQKSLFDEWHSVVFYKYTEGGPRNTKLSIHCETIPCLLQATCFGRKEPSLAKMKPIYLYLHFYIYIKPGDGPSGRFM